MVVLKISGIYTDKGEVELMKASNYVYCPKCGEEYNAANTKHECDPEILAQIEADRKADAEVRAKGDGES
jgi:hypothetical protein